MGVNYQVIFGGKNVGGNQTDIRFDGSDQLRIVTAAASLTMDFKTNRTFKSLATWYHIVVAVDTTDSTLLNRVKIYVDGVQETDLQTTICTVNTNCILNTATNQTTNVGALGYTTTVSNEFDGYLAEVNFIDGTQLDPTYFGQVGSNGYWVPKTITGVTYGENGFRLNFADSSDLGNDVSGRNNDFTVITSTFSATDQVIDSPTQNFATLVPMSNIALSEGNLKMTTSRTGNWDGTIGSFGVNSGKWYYEVRMSATEGTFRCVAGWQGNQASQTVTYNGKGASGSPYNTLFDNYQVSSHTTYFYKDGDTNGTTTAPSSGDVINVAVDFDAGKIWFGVNGTYYANDGGTDGNPGAGTNESLSGIDPTVQEYVPAFHIRSDSSTGGNVMIVNFGQEGTFVNTETAGGNSDANGVGNFFNAVPSGFLALVDDNIPQTGIKSPDWVWIKQRNGNSHSHYLFDSVRGPGKDLHSDVGNQEATSLTTLKSFDNQGFTVGTEDDVNDGLDTYVAWTWKAGGAPTVDNSAAANATPTAGSVKIDGANKTDAFSGSPDLAVTRLSANTTAGFSIVAYTGSSSNPKTVPHGLTQALDAIIVKRREGGDSWAVGHVSHGFNNSSNLRLEESSQASSGANGFSSDPDANVFTVGSEPVVNSASSYIAYCFHSVPGYSKFGSYVGNANADGAFVFTGFRPAWVMIKNVGTSGSWIIFDSTREGGVFNVINDHLMADTYADEGTDDDIDFLSNGFKCRRSSTSFNSDHTFIYFAFAEAPFKFANAR